MHHNTPNNHLIYQQYNANYLLVLRAKRPPKFINEDYFFMKTPEQVKQEFRAKGCTFAQFARENNVHVNEVYKVLNGQYKAHYGQAHEIAVALGLKKTSAHQAA